MAHNYISAVDGVACRGFWVSMAITGVHEYRIKWSPGEKNYIYAVIVVVVAGDNYPTIAPFTEGRHYHTNGNIHSTDTDQSSLNTSPISSCCCSLWLERTIKRLYHHYFLHFIYNLWTQSLIDLPFKGYQTLSRALSRKVKLFINL